MNLSQQKQVREIRDNTSLTDAQKKEQFQTLRKNEKESLKSVLTKDQLAKLNEMKKEHHEKHDQKKSNPKQPAQK